MARSYRKNHAASLLRTLTIIRNEVSMMQGKGGQKRYIISLLNTQVREVLELKAEEELDARKAKWVNDSAYMLSQYSGRDTTDE